MALTPKREKDGRGGGDDAVSRQMMAILMQAMIQGGFGLQQQKIAGETSRDVEKMRGASAERQTAESGRASVASAEARATGDVAAAEMAGNKNIEMQQVIGGINKATQDAAWEMENIRALSKIIGDLGEPMKTTDMQLKFHDDMARASDYHAAIVGGLKEFEALALGEHSRRELGELLQNSQRDKEKAVYDLVELEKSFDSKAQAMSLQLMSSYAKRPAGSTATYTEMLGFLDRNLMGKRDGGAVDMLAEALDSDTGLSAEKILGALNAGGAGTEVVQDLERTLRKGADYLGEQATMDPDSYPDGHPIHADRNKLLMMSLKVGSWDGGRKLPRAKTAAWWGDRSLDVDPETELPSALRRDQEVQAFFMTDPDFRERAFDAMGPAFQSQVLRDDYAKWYFARAEELGGGPIGDAYRSRMEKVSQEYTGTLIDKATEGIEDFRDQVQREAIFDFQNGKLMQAIPLLAQIQSSEDLDPAVVDSLTSGIFTYIDEITGAYPESPTDAARVISQRAANREGRASLGATLKGYELDVSQAKLTAEGKQLEAATKALTEMAWQRQQEQGTTKTTAAPKAAEGAAAPTGQDPVEMRIQQMELEDHQRAANKRRDSLPISSGMGPPSPAPTEAGPIDDPYAGMQDQGTPSPPQIPPEILEAINRPYTLRRPSSVGE